MKRLSRYLLIVVVFASLLFLFLSGHGNGTAGLIDFRPATGYLSWSKDSFSYSRTKPPKITIIVLWRIGGPTPPSYIPYFFQSVEANPQIDLLFVQVDELGFGCSTYSSASNIQEICLSGDQYYQLQVDFVCKRWKCSKEERVALFSQIKRDGEIDKNNSNFRLMRNGIFLRWIDPSTTIWGWCDVDTFWGNFTRAFPWDIAHDFDVLAPASQPEFSSQPLLFTRGHMAFFRHSPEVLDKFHSFPKFSSLTAYLTLPATLYDAEESEFSHYIFSEETSFTFLSFEAMVNSWDTVFVSGKGVFYAPSLRKKNVSSDRRKQLISLVRPMNRSPVIPTFSSEGIEDVAQVFRDGQAFEGSMWFDSSFLTYVETGWNQHEREQKAYFMRREPYGLITQRIESRERYLNRVGEVAVDESLYKHWQIEKHHCKC
ncbi:hypothetical protein DFH11DRAFT_1686098 [Phellopilus nigrolimitatus]|nr:hypothetical protein DFH11DRAFT_1686098 [Phellopilus nigrolimitatus]